MTSLTQVRLEVEAMHTSAEKLRALLQVAIAQEKALGDVLAISGADLQEMSTLTDTIRYGSSEALSELHRLGA